MNQHGRPRSLFWMVLLLALFASGPAFAQLTAGPEFRVDTSPGLTGSESPAAVDAAPDGRFVVAWTENNAGGTGFDVFFRRYDAAASPILGISQPHVPGPAGSHEDPAVSVDADGSFVLVWTYSPNPNDPEAPTSILGRSYDANGSPIGLLTSPFAVSGAESDLEAQAAVETRGLGFVAVWWGFVAEEGRSHVFARVFADNGAPAGPAFRVSTAPLEAPAHPRITRAGDGYAVAWIQDTREGALLRHVVTARLLDSSGDPVGEPFEVGDARDFESRVDVAGGIEGRFLVAWDGAATDTSGGSFLGRLFDAEGDPIGGELRLDDSDGIIEARRGSVASDAQGRFLAVWEGCCAPREFMDYDVYGRLVDPGGILLGGELVVSEKVGEAQAWPAAAGFGDSEFVTVWGEGFGIVQSSEIVGRRLGPAAGDVRFTQAQVTVEEGAEEVTLFVTRGGTGGAVSVGFRTENGSATGIAGTDFIPISGRISWAVGESGLKTITIPLINDRQVEPREFFAVVLTNPMGGAVIGQPSVATVTIVDDDGRPGPLTPDLQVAGETTDLLGRGPGVAADPARPGRWAVAWTERPDPDGNPVVRGRFYGPAEIRDFDIGTGFSPALAWAPGRLLVVWIGPQAIQGRIFNSDTGAPLTGPFTVDLAQGSLASRPRACWTGTGPFVVVWDAVGQGFDVKARRFSRTGSALTGAFTVNTTRTFDQKAPDVGCAADGSFVVVWHGDVAPSGLESDIFLQRFGPNQERRGGEVRVNTTIPGRQTNPSVDVDGRGNFLVAWTTPAGADNGDIAGQAFNANGARIGGQFRINTFTDLLQFQPRVAAFPFGGFMVVWSSGTIQGFGGETQGQDGSFLGVFGQRLTSQGQRVGGEFPVNAITPGSQTNPDVAADANGEFAVAWESYAEGSFADRRTWVRFFSGASRFCEAGPTTLCLGAGRFEVRTRWRTPGSEEGEGRAVPLTVDTGYFTFFNPDNVEVVVKALDACGFTGSYWLFAGGLTNVFVETTVTDVATGATQIYTNPQGRAFQPIQDTDAFRTCGAPPPLVPPPAAPVVLPPAVECGGGPGALCLAGGRFRVEVQWERPGGETGVGHGVQLTEDTGFFWFFDKNNVEIVVKTLNACGHNPPRYWVFAGGLTNVQVWMTVFDTLRGAGKAYENPQGTPFQPIQDTGAFETCP